MNTQIEPLLVADLVLDTDAWLDDDVLERAVLAAMDEPQFRPILVDADTMAVISGRARVAAAKALGIVSVPGVKISTAPRAPEPGK